MKFKILALIVLLAFSGFALSETLSEVSLKQANFQGLVAEGQEVQQCATYAFLKEAIAEQKGVFIVFSAHALFSPASQGNAKVSVFLNNFETLAEFKPVDFQNGWARVEVPINGLLEKNSLKVCAKTTSSITKVEVLDDSTIGYYKMPKFELKKAVSETRPIIGRELEITLTATNIGSEAATAKISYWNIELNIAQITRGDSEFNGIIQPGQSVTMRYFVKPKYAVQMDLASAILEFDNIFGEKQTVYSNRPTIWVQEPEFKVKAFYSITEQKAFQPGQSTTLVLTARNEGVNDLENISIKVVKPEGLIVSKDSFENISLKAGASKTFEISASSLEEGILQIGCSVEYSDYKVVNTKCAPLNIEFEKPKQNNLLIFAIVLLIVGAIIYAFIYRPEKKKAEK
ncbi:MAG: hypothetical protein Q7R70_00700 [Candidatus Diapherotrites archaeon]|nr:hypothetical protein [Candidatus Diapherotrites archaeon]